ncbi:hypothetical protein BJP40_19120 [Streptomyces sp. CC53]|uniref:hypothetical protein n=1 Tax=Streptomyces sp. CC53 TaxID=1906740 RepID=UPI0008DE9D4F|nr:hypothetical protein [Streptomyces sp. CC53]OII64808.1 hypothetical protein BJP40_19120 [Streptomyces sp. CC53]
MSDLHEDETARSWVVQAIDVLAMDTLWTRQLGSDHMTPDEMRSMADLGDGLREAWLRLTSDAALNQIDRYMHRHADRAARLAARHGPEGVPMERSALAKRAHSSVGVLRELHGLEAFTLEGKIDSLRAEVWTPGDLSEQAICALLFLSSVVALVVGLAEVAGGLWTWFLASKCRNVALGFGEGGG